MLKIETFVFIGKNGKVLEDETYYIGHNSSDYLLKYAPRIEIDSIFIQHRHKQRKSFMQTTSEEKYITRMAEEAYRQWGRYGHWKDVVVITKYYNSSESIYKVDFIGRFGYDKPGMTSDLIPFIRDKNGRVFFIGIYRKFPPGVGKPATIGGFRNINDYHFATATEAAISEGREEASFKIVSLDKKMLKTIPMPFCMPVEVILGKDNPVKVKTNLLLVRAFQTANVERRKSLKMKRVSETVGYTVLVDIDMELTKVDLKKMFKADDDALGLMIVEMGKDSFPNFYSSHHEEILKEAMEMFNLKQET